MTIRHAGLAALTLLVLAACNQNEDPAKEPETAAEASKEAPAAQAASVARMHPAPGLWKTTLTAGGAPMSANRMCYDLGVAQKMGLMGRTPGEGEACTETVTPQADGSIAFTSTCSGRQIGGVMRGDLSKGYTVEFDSAGQKMKLESQREGDCPADFKPGDMEVQGVRINVLDKL